MLWVSVGAGMLDMFMNTRNAKASERNQKKLSEANRNNAVIAQTYSNRGANEQLRQGEEVAADQELELQIQALQASSSLQTVNNGVAGVSIDRKQSSVGMALSKALSQMESNAAGARAQLAMQKKGTEARTTGRINSMPFYTNTYNPAVDIAKTGLQIYGGYQDSNAALKNADKPTQSFTQYVFGD